MPGEPPIDAAIRPRGRAARRPLASLRRVQAGRQRGPSRPRRGLSGEVRQRFIADMRSGTLRSAASSREEGRPPCQRTTRRTRGSRGSTEKFDSSPHVTQQPSRKNGGSSQVTGSPQCGHSMGEFGALLNDSVQRPAERVRCNASFSKPWARQMRPRWLALPDRLGHLGWAATVAGSLTGRATTTSIVPIPTAAKFLATSITPTVVGPVSRRKKAAKHYPFSGACVFARCRPC